MVLSPVQSRRSSWSREGGGGGAGAGWQARPGARLSSKSMDRLDVLRSYNSQGIRRPLCSDCSGEDGLTDLAGECRWPECCRELMPTLQHYPELGGRPLAKGWAKFHFNSVELGVSIIYDEEPLHHHPLITEAMIVAT